jgi:hypothetical protein
MFGQQNADCWPLSLARYLQAQWVIRKIDV